MEMRRGPRNEPQDTPMWGGGEAGDSQWRSPRGVARNPGRIWWPRSQEREALEDRQYQQWSPPETWSPMSLRGLAKRSYYNDCEKTEFSVATSPIRAKWRRKWRGGFRTTSEKFALTCEPCTMKSHSVQRMFPSFCFFLWQMACCPPIPVLGYR